VTINELALVNGSSKQGGLIEVRGPPALLFFYGTLTMSSITFFASPNTIIVLSI
jgi:hypothetical protein